MFRKGVIFLRSFGIIGIMTVGMIGQAPSGVNATDCWCGHEKPREGETRIWYCQKIVAVFAYINPENSQTECDTACSSVFVQNQHHYWGGYGDAKAECKNEPIKEKWNQPYRVDIDDTSYEFFQ